MDLPGYACLSRDAARASALCWAEPMDQPGHDRAVRHLGIALRDLRIVVAQLAARFRLSATARPDPARTARAAAATASTQALEQAWLVLADVLTAGVIPAYSACVPADLLCFATRRAATWRIPASGLDEVALPLADALAALEDGTAHLAAGAAPPLAARLTAVRACLQAAGNQLRNVPQAAGLAVTARGCRPESPSGIRTSVPASCRQRQAW
jgi:hypothetical protein